METQPFDIFLEQLKHMDISTIKNLCKTSKKMLERCRHERAYLIIRDKVLEREVENALGIPVEKWEMLEIINLNDSDLDSLPSSISLWENATDILLGGNKITRLPPEIEHWKNVEFVGLSHNKLTSLHPNIKYWKKLEELDISNNNLTFLPDIQDLKNLSRLTVSNNQLKQLPKNIPKKLKKIFAQNNLFDKLPKIENVFIFS